MTKKDKKIENSLRSLISKDYDAYIYHKDLDVKSLPVRNAYLVTKRGVKFIHRNEIGTFIFDAIKDNYNFVFFPGAAYFNRRKFFYLNIPKIPIALLKQIIAFFTAVFKQHGTEAYAQIKYNKDEKSYYVHVPTMYVGHTSVEWEDDSEDDGLIVVEAHSHPDFNVEFSQVDDRDQQGTRFHLLVKNVNTPTPSVSIRVTYGNIDPITVDVNDIFINDDEDTFPAEWLTKVKIKQPTRKLSI